MEERREEGGIFMWLQHRLDRGEELQVRLERAWGDSHERPFKDLVM